MSATIVLCLGFSIGATGTVFAWTETMIVQPLTGVEAIDRLVSLKTTTANDEDDLSYPDYKDTRDAEARANAKTFEGLAAFSIRRINLRISPAAEARLAEPIWGVLASANYFDVLGVRPIVGRGFVPGEDAVERGAPVVVISHALWQRRFGGDAGVIGRPVWIDDRAMTIVGVAPPDFYGTISHLAMDLWIPVTMQPEVGGSPVTCFQERAHTVAGGIRAPRARRHRSRPRAPPRRRQGIRLAAGFAEDRDWRTDRARLDVGPGDRMAPLFTVMLGISGLVRPHRLLERRQPAAAARRGARARNGGPARHGRPSRPHRAAAYDREPAPRGRGRVWAAPSWRGRGTRSPRSYRGLPCRS